MQNPLKKFQKFPSVVENPPITAVPFVDESVQLLQVVATVPTAATDVCPVQIRVPLGGNWR